MYIYREREQIKLTQISNYQFHVYTFIRLTYCKPDECVNMKLIFAYLS